MCYILAKYGLNRLLWADFGTCIILCCGEIFEFNKKTNILEYVGTQVLRGVVMKIYIFWDITSAVR
jgi:hypothetical protein